jgi:lysophospholipase L1-like esterase
MRALICFLLLAGHVSAAENIPWIATWAASPKAAEVVGPREPLTKIDNQTVRERFRVSIGGPRICVRLSNEYGSTPLEIGSATVAMPIDPASVKPESIQAVTFGGRNSVTIPAGAPVLSDPIAFAVAPGAEIAISIYFPNRVLTPTLHELALKRAVVSPPGDHTRTAKIEGGAVSKALISVSAVLVPSAPGQRLIVAFGDSLTDGDGSSVDQDHTWPALLSGRLRKATDGSTTAVVNEGIAGNRLLADFIGTGALARFDRDALALPGVTHIVLFEGLNDIGFPGAQLGQDYLDDPAHARTAEDLFGAYRQLVSRAHAHGIKAIGATITPFRNAPIPGYYSESKEKVRQAVNQWIRTSGAFDGVIDFDAVVRNPEHPDRLLPRFAAKDGLHPNDLGYQAMADAVDLTLFR